MAPTHVAREGAASEMAIGRARGRRREAEVRSAPDAVEDAL